MFLDITADRINLTNPSKSNQRLTATFHELKELFGQAVSQQNAHFLNEKLKEISNAIPFYRDSHCDEAAEENQQILDRFLQWVTEEWWMRRRAMKKLIRSEN